MPLRASGARSLRVRLIVLLAVCLAPIAAISVYESLRSYEQQQARAREILLQTARLSVDEETSLFASTERVLKALAAQPSVVQIADPACSIELDNAFRPFPEYSEAAVITPDGALHCVDAEGARFGDVNDLDWYQEVANGRPFVLSRPMTGRLSGLPVLVAAVPVRRDGAFVGTLSVGIRLSWFNRWTRYYGLPRDAMVTLVDERGEPLTGRGLSPAGQPTGGGEGRTTSGSASAAAPAGAMPQSADLVPHLGREPVVFEARVGDGAPHVYAIAPIYGESIYALFGLPESGLFGSARQDLATRIAGPVAMWLVALIASWFAVDRFVLRWIGQLRRTARAYALGRYEVRAGVDRAPEELRELGETFEAMAGLIRSRTGDLERSLDEKETLIKEIHHRVKNNLQTITSLLSLQARRLPTGRDRQILRDAQTRITALATVHRSIYETEGLDSVVLSDFLSHLAQQVRDIVGVPAERLSISVDVPERPIPQDRAVPIALLVNEAVTNAIKHGLADDRPGRITIAMRPHGDGWRLEISDNGTGPGTGAEDGRDGHGLGRSLMAAFAEQLDGTLTVEADGGTMVRLDFPHL